MINIKDIEVIRSKTFILVIFNLVFLVLPGISIIYIYNEAMFLSLQLGKLLLLAAAISAPLSFVNNAVIDTMEGTETKPDEFVNFSLGILLAGICLYTCLLLGYFTGLSVGMIVGLAYGADFLALIGMTIQSKKKNR